MEKTNGEMVINQIESAVNQDASEWRDWDNEWDEGPWDKESWSDNWDDSHGR